MDTMDAETGRHDHCSMDFRLPQRRRAYHELHRQPPRPSLPLYGGVSDHEQAYLDSLAPGGRKAQLSAIRRLNEVIGKPINEWTYPEYQTANRFLRRQYHPVSATRMWSAVKAVTRERWRRGELTSDERDRLIDFSPFKGNSAPTGRCLTLDEVRTLTAGDSPAAVIIDFLLHTGLRKAEAAGLTKPDLFGRGSFVVRGKGSKYRTIPLSEGLRDRVLSAFRGPSLLLFGKSPIALDRCVARHVRRLGIENVTMHDFRRTFASRCLDMGVDLVTVQRLMGHSNPQTTARYDRRRIEESGARATTIWEER